MITTDEMTKYILTCPHCRKRLNSWYKGNFRGTYFSEILKSMRPRTFCTEECYNEYIQSFVVEIFNDKPIYCIEVDGEKRYMPYFEASYYFTNIDDCKKRMKSKVAYLPPLMM